LCQAKALCERKLEYCRILEKTHPKNVGKYSIEYLSYKHKNIFKPSYVETMVDSVPERFLLYLFKGCISNKQEWVRMGKTTYIAYKNQDGQVIKKLN
jgi:hypothetical protein